MFLKNKDGILIKTKCDVSLLKLYLDSYETKVASNDTEKVESPSSANMQILIEERIDSYAITNLLNEVTEMMLFNALKLSKNSTGT